MLTKLKQRPRGKPFVPGDPRAGRPAGTPNKITREIREAARALLEDPAYVAALQTRLLEGTAGAVETLLYHYGYGQPKQTIEHQIPMRPLVVDLLDPAALPHDDHDDD